METTKERRKLGMHEKLLFDTIQRQAGTLEKANVEGIMNSIEADATKVETTLLADGENAYMSIVDDGIGITTKEEMEAHFETFGTPHDESENTHWKQFRMGRGQMFAFGKNTWRTGPFRMHVDIKNDGLEWDLEENLKEVKGCNIEIDLYKNPIGNYPYYSMDGYRDALQTQVAFVEIPTFFNGEQVNTPPSECDWDYEDDEAYYLFNAGTDLLIYNLGIFVMKIPASRAGMDGIVVSKKQLKVNFARNDVLSDCPVYNHVNEIVKKNRIKKVRQARRNLSYNERKATVKDLRDGTQYLDDVKTLSIIPTAQGKHVSLNFMKKLKQPWCFAPEGDQYADRLMEREQAFCLSDSILHHVGYKGHKKNFFVWLLTAEADMKHEWRAESFLKEWKELAVLYTDYNSLKEGISESFIPLSTKKYTATERRIVQVLQDFDCWNGRRILLGSSDTAIGWTDGSSYICIDRQWLKRRSISYGQDVAKIMMLLSHEMAHDEDSRGTHIHGPEFYENQILILESSDSPINYCASFKYKMERSRIEERRVKEAQKKQKKQEKLNSKLGVAAKLA